MFASVLPLRSLTSDLVNPAPLHCPRRRPEKLQLVAALTLTSAGMVPLLMWMAETRLASTWLQTTQNQSVG